MKIFLILRALLYSISSGGAVMKAVTFNEALEIIESLPEEQREDLLEVVKKRLIEERRGKLAQNIAEARDEYARGEGKRGSVDDLLRELSE
jgi:hypothetical protein